jgi:hypothetical protein
MSPARTPLLVGIVVGSLSGLLALSFPTGLGFAAVFAVTYGVGAWSFAHRWDLWRNGNRWSGGLAGLVTFAAVTGIQQLPIDPDTRFPVGLLVVGLGFASAGLTAEFVFEALKQGQITGVSAPDSDCQ